MHTNFKKEKILTPRKVWQLLLNYLPVSETLLVPFDRHLHKLLLSIVSRPRISKEVVLLTTEMFGSSSTLPTVRDHGHGNMSDSAFLTMTGLGHNRHSQLQPLCTNARTLGSTGMHSYQLNSPLDGGLVLLFPPATSSLYGSQAHIVVSSLLKATLRWRNTFQSLPP